MPSPQTSTLNPTAFLTLFHTPKKDWRDGGRISKSSTILLNTLIVITEINRLYDQRPIVEKQASTMGVGKKSAGKSDGVTPEKNEAANRKAF
ncbi:MAG: hypothetical protein M1827_004447 [Pycnora praestabilis]|nr:MAG: hypothetical protein M1827_004447 [Pycnora praestabilis]